MFSLEQKLVILGAALLIAIVLPFQYTIERVVCTMEGTTPVCVVDETRWLMPSTPAETYDMSTLDPMAMETRTGEWVLGFWDRRGPAWKSRPQPSPEAVEDIVADIDDVLTGLRSEATMSTGSYWPVFVGQGTCGVMLFALGIMGWVDRPRWGPR